MTDTKTSLETAATALDGTEIVRGVQAGANVKLTVNQIATKVLAGAVSSVNTRTGAVALTATDVGLGLVNNTADASKPVSAAQAAADSAVATNASTALTAHTSNIANPHAVTPSQIGLGNLDNTSDIAKPVSTAQQTALNSKAPLASPTFSGVVGLPAGQSVNGVTLSVAAGTSAFLRGDGSYAAPSGGGDMLLAGTQTITGAKTFNAGALLLNNVANNFASLFTNTNTAARTYTLKDASGTVAFTSDITGVNSGTNTGDNAANTLYSGFSTTKQDTLVSGTTIKTVNSLSLLGAGNLVISGGSGGGAEAVPAGVGDMVTDDTSAVATWLSGLSPVKAGRFLNRHAVTAFDNSLGAPLVGAGFARLTSGALRGISSLRKPRMFFGEELLHAFHSRLYGGSTHTIQMTGDSTTSLFDSTLLPKYASRKLYSACTFDNRGHAGASAADWVTTYLAGDIAAAPHLMIIRWGANDPYYSRTAAQAIASIRSALTTIRGTAGRDLKGLSILLCTPTVMSDTTNGRDEAYAEQMSSGLRQAAIDFDCAFLDLYGIFTNARGGSYATGNSAAQLWMDDPYTNGSAIHPNAMHNCRIAQVIADAIYKPLEIATYFGGEPYGAYSATSTVRVAANADAPTTYPYGVSTYRYIGGTGFGSMDGFIHTFRHYDQYPFQINTGFAGQTVFYFRTATSGSAWTAWTAVGSNAVSAAATPGTGFTQPAAEQMTSFWDGRSNGTVTVDGYLAKTTVSALTAGQSIGTVAHIPGSNKTYCQLGLYSGTWEYALGEISGSTISIVGASVSTSVSRVYITATYRKA